MNPIETLNSCRCCIIDRRRRRPASLCVCVWVCGCVGVWVYCVCVSVCRLRLRVLAQAHACSAHMYAHMASARVLQNEWTGPFDLYAYTHMAHTYAFYTVLYIYTHILYTRIHEKYIHAQARVEGIICTGRLASLEAFRARSL